MKTPRCQQTTRAPGEVLLGVLYAEEPQEEWPR